VDGGGVFGFGVVRQWRQGGIEPTGSHAPAGSQYLINPDGPYGPAHGVKNGVLELAQRSGLPVLAIRVTCSRALRLPTWDRKFLPLPGSRVIFEYSSPIQVTATSLESVREQITQHMNG
jgi:lysophospholipid acyltransferase (LPLAT)-like uncharacterized protein